MVIFFLINVVVVVIMVTVVVFVVVAAAAVVIIIIVIIVLIVVVVSFAILAALAVAVRVFGLRGNGRGAGPAAGLSSAATACRVFGGRLDLLRSSLGWVGWVLPDRALLDLPTTPEHHDTRTPEHHTHTSRRSGSKHTTSQGSPPSRGPEMGVSYLHQAHVAVAAARLAVHQALHVLALVGVWRGVERYEETGDG